MPQCRAPQVILRARQHMNIWFLKKFFVIHEYFGKNFIRNRARQKFSYKQLVLCPHTNSIVQIAVNPRWKTKTRNFPILNPQSSTLSPHYSIFNPQPSILSPQSSIHNPWSSIFWNQPDGQNKNGFLYLVIILSIVI